MTRGADRSAVVDGPAAALPKPRPHVLSLAPFALAERTVAPHLRAIHLAQNENATPPGKAALAVMQAALAAVNRYPEADAATLREAIAAAENLPAGRIVCGAGSMELLALLAQGYLGPDDEVVISDYGYVFFRTVAELVGARVVLAPERNFRTDIDAMLARVGPRTRMLFLANPNNPTGSLLSRTELHSLRASLRSDIMLVIDAAYAEYVTEPDYEAGAALVDADANTVMMRTFSKVHGLAGLRVGWGYFPPAIADVVNRLRHPNNVGSIAIAAAAAAIADRAHVAAVRAANADLRTWFSRELRQIGLAPCESHGNFVLLPFTSGGDAAAAKDFLKSRGILIRPMTAYGLDRCLRITLGTRDELVAVLDALRLGAAGTESS
ncbi:MAG TPA: histidinol-phosphate transaminase [Methylomirabilota bacterium]|nr:histidinol-phosphate transaminase [Methylomirabilota bacterium]